MIKEEEWLSKILCCPRCQSNLQYEQVSGGYLCLQCSLRYPLRKGILSFVNPEKLSDEKNSNSSTQETR